MDNSAYPQGDCGHPALTENPRECGGAGPHNHGIRFCAASRRTAAPALARTDVARAGTGEGWGYAMLLPTSVQADNGEGLTPGIIGLVNKGQPRKVDDWGALRAWAWGASRALDYFETDKLVDAKRVGIEGHSRYGKATGVAMAYDPRFAIAFIGSSGAGGIKLHRCNGVNSWRM